MWATVLITVLSHMRKRTSVACVHSSLSKHRSDRCRERMPVRYGTCSSQLSVGHMKFNENVNGKLSNVNGKWCREIVMIPFYPTCNKFHGRLPSCNSSPVYLSLQWLTPCNLLDLMKTCKHKAFISTDTDSSTICPTE